MRGRYFPMPRCRLVAASVALLLLCGCDKDPAESKQRWTDQAVPARAPIVQRWYTQDQVATGALLYRAHCAPCHKDNAEGTPEWKKRDESGKFPPPPLNGTAHAWHHPLKILRRVVRTGGIPLGGSMPPFADKLNARQIDAVLAWVQSHWSDEIYAQWRKQDRKAR